MSVFGWFGSLFGDSDSSCNTVINPASGLPMIDGYGGVDVAGNVYGTDSNNSSHDTGGASWDSGPGFESGTSFGSDSSSSSDPGISSSIDTSSSFGLNDW